MSKKWTYEECFQEALKYNGRYEFQKKNSSAYHYAYNNNILDKVCAHMKPKQKSWTYELLASEALKSHSRSEFQRNSPVAYTTSLIRGILDEICGHMDVLHRNWTNDELKTEALKYKNRSDFVKNSCGAYTTATRRGILDDVCKHMERQGSRLFRGLYVFEYPISKKAYVGLTYNYEERYSAHLRKTKCIIEMDKTEKHIFRPLGIFYPKEEAAILEQKLIEEYRDNGWTLLNRVRGGNLGGNVLQWTKDKLIKEALKYKTRWDFVKGSLGAYDSAHRQGLLNEICSHMPKFDKKSVSEKNSKPIKCHQNGKTYSSIGEAAKKLKINASSISMVLHGKRKHAKGKTFEFIDKN